MDAKEIRLARDLAEVINRHSFENKSNTPDFILAEALVELLRGLSRAINARDRWYSIEPSPGSDWRMDGQLAGYLSGALPELHGVHPETIYKAIRAFRETPPDVEPPSQEVR